MYSFNLIIYSSNYIQPHIDKRLRAGMNVSEGNKADLGKNIPDKE